MGVVSRVLARLYRKAQWTLGNKGFSNKTKFAWGRWHSCVQLLSCSQNWLSDNTTLYQISIVKGSSFSLHVIMIKQAGTFYNSNILLIVVDLCLTQSYWQRWKLFPKLNRFFHLMQQLFWEERKISAIVSLSYSHADPCEHVPIYCSVPVHVFASCKTFQKDNSWVTRFVK